MFTRKTTTKGAAACIVAIVVTASALRGQTGSVPEARHVTFNGRNLNATGERTLEILESRYGARLPDGDFWYDSRTGAFGVWGGPAVALLPPGLKLGGPMPSNCSGGGTAVFVNGRELHPYDLAVLSQLGPVLPGRYWVNANGDFGFERGMRLGNLYALAQQQARARKEPMWGASDGGFSNSAGTCTKSGNCSYPDR